MTQPARPGHPGLSLRDFRPGRWEGWRYELVRGQLVREPPAGFEHGRIALNVAALLQRFARERRLGVVVGAETGFLLREEPPTVRAPDAAFVTAARVAGGSSSEGFFRGAPDLAVEIRSPSDSLAAIEQKVDDYLSAGASLVWLVDADSRTVRVFGAAGPGTVLDETAELHGEPALPGFRARVAELFTS
jgi:Uma2 family endonuclease